MTARDHWSHFATGVKALWTDFVNTANPNKLNEDTVDENQPLYSDNRFECMDYHTPFPSMYLEHLRSNRVTYEGSNRLRGDSISNRSVVGKGVNPRSGSADSSATDDADDSSALSNSMRQSMRHVARTVKTLNTTHRGSIILRWILHVVIALAVAIVAFGMIWGADSMYEWRYHTLRSIVKDEATNKDKGLGAYLLGWLFWVSTSAVIVAVAAGAVHFVPAAGGSGLPDVISFLNGVMRPRVVNLVTFVAKAISSVCCVGGGLPAGMEAPLIHIGAIVGSGVTQGRSRTLNCKTSLFQSMRTNKDRRDFITAGAACGVAAGFGAPIGGLLFIMEEVASFWDHNNSGQVFLATMTTFTTIAFFNSLKNELLHNVYVLFEVDVKIPLNITAIIPAIFLGAICGLLASAFTKVNMMLTKWRRRVIRPYAFRKFFEPVAIAILFVSVSYWIGLAGPCQDTVAGGNEGGDIVHWETENITALSAIGCNGKEVFNPLATLTMKTSKEAIRHLFTRRTVNAFPAGTLIVFFLLYIVAACYTNGSAVSTGLVIPMLVIGATVGRIFGLILVKGFASSIEGQSDVYKYDQSWMDPGVYALIGAGAFFSGCTRMMISVCVLMVELAGDLHYLLPGMVAIVISKITADYFSKSLYHAQLHLDHVPFLPSHWDESMMEAYTAADVMSSNVVSLREQEYTSVILAALRSTVHNAFPVVRPMEDGSEKFVGMVTREDIQVYLALPELQVAEATTPRESPESNFIKQGNNGKRETPHEAISPVNHQPSDLLPENMPVCVKEVSSLTWTEWLQHQSSLFLKMGDRRWHEAWDNQLASLGAGANGAGINLTSLPPVVDISIITNRSPYVVPPFFNLSLTYSMFRSVGLRHLVVLDGQTVVGIITRKDLLNFSEKGLRMGSTKEFHPEPAVVHPTRSRGNSMTDGKAVRTASNTAVRTTSMGKNESEAKKAYTVSDSSLSEMRSAGRFVAAADDTNNVNTTAHPLSNASVPQGVQPTLSTMSPHNDERGTTVSSSTQPSTAAPQDELDRIFGN